METTVLGNGRGDQNIWFAGTMRSVRNSRGRKKDILQWHLIQSLNLKADVHLQDLSQSN